MKKDNSKNIILDYQDVENKIKRISLEILEDNIDQKKLLEESKKLETWEIKE